MSAIISARDMHMGGSATGRPKKLASLGHSCRERQTGKEHSHLAGHWQCVGGSSCERVKERVGLLTWFQRKMSPLETL